MRLLTNLRLWLTRAHWRQLGHILFEAGRSFFRANGPSWAAAIAYYSLLSLFPLLIGIASMAAVFVDPDWAVTEATRLLGEYLPRGSGVIERIMGETLGAARSTGWIFSLPLFWTGSLVFNAIAKALNAATEATDHYGYFKRTVVRAAMLLALLGMFAIALLGPVLLRVLRVTLNFLPLVGEFLFGVIVNTLPGTFLLCGLALAYRFVPAKSPRTGAAIFGAFIATLLFLGAKPVFLGYVKHLARYNVIYGSIAGLIVLQIWSWVVAMIALYGGHVSARYDRSSSASR
jgi:membrane protein